MPEKRQDKPLPPSNVTPLRQLFQLKVTLKHIQPPIWRRLLVDSRITLDALHSVIQISMGWQNCHLHHFIDRQNTIYEPVDEDNVEFSNPDFIDESLILLNEVLIQEKDWISYEYDFGDGWEHKIVLEKILPIEKNQLPVSCIKGKRACPPEDCGGPWGYQSLLQAMAEPDRPEHAELLEWLEDDLEDPEYFSTAETNAVLLEFFEDVEFKAKPGLSGELQRVENSASEMNLLDGNLFERLLSGADSPPEMQQLLQGGMQDTIELVMEMSNLLDQAEEAFQTIAQLSKDRKVVAVAKKMLKALEE